MMPLEMERGGEFGRYENKESEFGGHPYRFNSITVTPIKQIAALIHTFSHPASGDQSTNPTELPSQ
uniref:hypothetical protein n=1 Tax=Alicyclobacillus tolerans TaxID=90970 RepID=UPI0027DF647C|nr:hypothetical protein [Alicyclobacillus tolerans]